MDWHILILTLSLVLGSLPLVSAQSEYIVPLLGRQGPSDKTVQVHLLMSRRDNNSPFNVSVTKVGHKTQSKQHKTIYSGKEFNYTLTDDDFLTGSQIGDEHFLIYSSNTFDLNVIFYKGGYYEGYTAVPNGYLGYKYYVSTFCAHGWLCQIAVAPVSKTNNTVVSLLFPANVVDVVFCVGFSKWRNTEDTLVVLKPGEVLQIESAQDLTGTRIAADFKIGVVVGSRSGSDAWYHMVEQLVPYSHWGTEFIVSPLGASPYGALVHIISQKRQTVVAMSGYPTVELPEYGQTIRRRVDLSKLSYIRSTKQIQVVMYTDFTYNTTVTGNHPGMTLVPAIEHFIEGYKIIRDFPAQGNFPLIQAILQSGESISVDGNAQSVTRYHVPYEIYDVLEINNPLSVSSTAFSFINTVQTSSFGMLVTYETSAVFPPVAMIIDASSTCTVTAGTMAPGDGIDNNCGGKTDEQICFENRKAVALFAPFEGNGSLPYLENIEKFRTIKVRVQSCGAIMMGLRSDVNNTLLVHVTTSSILVYACHPNCNLAAQREKMSEEVTKNCESDMSHFWFKQNKSHVCVGTGPVPAVDCTGIHLAVLVPSLPVQIQLGGLNAEATFWTDLFRADCAKLESDWRCDDMVTDCRQHVNDTCTNANYAGWVSQNCRKFCNLCSPDSFGKKAVIGLPDNNNNAYTVKVHIIPDQPVDGTPAGVMVYNENYAVFELQPTDIYPKDIRDFPANYTFQMDSSWITDWWSLVYFFSDVDAAVFVEYTRSGVGLNPTYFSVLPLDTLGTEYMTLSFTSTTTCVIVASEYPADLWQLTPTVSTSLGQLLPGSKLQVTLAAAETTGTVFKSSQPMAVYCGNIHNTATGEVPAWNQLPSTSTWGTEYRTPILSTTVTSLFKLTARFLCNSDNTVLVVSGDYNSKHVLLSRGNYVDRVLDPSISYHIVANRSFAVGILFQQQSQLDKGMFDFLQPTSNFMNNPLLFGYRNSGSNIEVGTVNASAAYAPTVDTVVPLTDLVYGVTSKKTYAIMYRPPYTSIDYLVITLSTSLMRDMSEVYLCHVSSGSQSDGVDNDCDGLIDESETCYTGYGANQTDYDIDGGFGEDCLTVVEAAQAPLPPEPICPTMDKPGDQCWGVCQCYCSWVDELSQYENMTDEEKSTHNQAVIHQYQKHMDIDEKTLSATTATKASANDDRMSSKTMGVVGITILSLTFGTFVLLDLINLFNYLCNRRA